MEIQSPIFKNKRKVDNKAGGFALNLTNIDTVKT